MIFNIRPIVTTTVLIITLTLCYIDYKRKRKKIEIPPITYIIPCYNDWNTIQETIKSIYECSPNKSLQLIIVNDNSKDSSKNHIDALKSKYKFEFIDQTQNTWKAIALNNSIKYAKNDIIIFIDADSLLNEHALNDMISRLYSKENIAAVTCPYKPINKWFLAFMQHMEYNLAKLSMGAYNVRSENISMRWWCIAIKKQAFIEAGMFSKNALSEDMDLAMKLREKGYWVEQSLISIYTDVPVDIKTRYKQKIRRSSWGMQAMISHFKVLIKSPMLIIFLILLYVTVWIWFYFLIKNLIAFWNFFNFASDLFHITTFTKWMSILNLVYGENAVSNTLRWLTFTILTIPYVIPTIQKRSDIINIFYVIPFSIIYLPIHWTIRILWSIYWVYKYIKLKDHNSRAR